MTTPDTLAEDFGRESIGTKSRPRKVEIRQWDGGLITEPGVYRGLPNEVYHGKEICAGPSVSATGLKILANDKGARTKGQTPRHFFETSHLNPKRKEKKETDALRIGRAFHDALLLPDLWESDYHRLPEGFSRAASKAQADAIADADKAIKGGLVCMKAGEVVFIDAMVDALFDDPIFADLASEGEAELTFAWLDDETGVWLRARPDWLRPKLDIGINVKTAADASYTGFSRMIATGGYAQSAALELDAMEAVLGKAPPRYFFPVIEKPPIGDYEEGDFLATAIWELPAEDVERGRWLNRIGIRNFATCLKAGEWPGYTPEPELCGLPSYARHVIDNGGAAEPADDEITVS